MRGSFGRRAVVRFDPFGSRFRLLPRASVSFGETGDEVISIAWLFGVFSWCWAATRLTEDELRDLQIW